MSVALKKGEKIKLSKNTLKHVNVGLGWDCNEKLGSTFDLDAWAVAVQNGQLRQKNLLYFGNKLVLDGLMHHMGDNLTGEGEGDDETLEINLEDMPDNVSDILIGVTIYRGLQKKQSFKDVNNTFIRVYNADTNYEICRCDSEFRGSAGDYQTMLFGILYRTEQDSSTWEFKAVGEGSKVSRIPDALKVYADYALTKNKLLNENGGNKKMAVSLSKGGKISLTKTAADAGIAQLTKVVVGLGWDANRYDSGADFDLDASAFLTGANGKVRKDSDFVFYGSSHKAPNGMQSDEADSVLYTGDNRTGDAEGDDEQLIVDLTKVPADVDKISFSITVYDADKRRQNFGMVQNAYVHVIDENTGTELVRFDLGEDYSVETAVVVCELYRHNGEWKFNAVGAGWQGGLKALCANFGIDAE
jgi:tellurium resistance protein TerD